MPINPSKSLHFDSWEKLSSWLPEANENQLMTVYVWAGDLKAPVNDVTRLAQIRKEAFELLVTRTTNRLKCYVSRRLGCQDSHQVEDVVQQVIIKLYLRAEQFDPRRSFWGWLFRITHNEYIDTLRKVRPGSVGTGQLGQSEKEFEEWLAKTAKYTDHPPEKKLMEGERNHKLEAAIASLPNLQRTIVKLKGEGVKGKEIAKQLGISQAYVSQLFHEAAEVLRETVE